MTDATAAVAVTDVEVVYQRGAEPAIRDVSFAIPQGTGLVVVGAEGAGKTTLLRAVLSLAVASGEIRLFGADPGDPHLRRRVGYGPQGRAYLEGSSPFELLRVIVRLRAGAAPADRVGDALTRAGLPEPRWRSRSLDVEEVGRVSLACAIAGDPDLLVMDEPWEFQETHDEISQAMGRGAAVLIATRDPGHLPAVVGRQATIDGGRLT